MCGHAMVFHYYFIKEGNRTVVKSTDVANTLSFHSNKGYFNYAQSINKNYMLAFDIVKKILAALFN